MQISNCRRKRKNFDQKPIGIPLLRVLCPGSDKLLEFFQNILFGLLNEMIDVLIMNIKVPRLISAVSASSFYRNFLDTFLRNQFDERGTQLALRLSDSPVNGLGLHNSSFLRGILFCYYT